MADVAIAGTIFHAHMRTLRQLVGEDTFASALATLDPKVQLEVNAGGAIGWVSFVTIESVVHAVAERSNRPIEALQREMVFATTREVLSGIWRLLAKAVSAETLLSRIDTLWSRTYNRGTVLVENATATSATIRVSEFGATTDYVLRGMALSIEALLTEQGRRAIRVKIERTADGALLHVQWRA